MCSASGHLKLVYRLQSYLCVCSPDDTMLLISKYLAKFQICLPRLLVHLPKCIFCAEAAWIWLRDSSCYLRLVTVMCWKHSSLASIFVMYTGGCHQCHNAAGRCSQSGGGRDGRERHRGRCLDTLCVLLRGDHRAWAECVCRTLPGLLLWGASSFHITPFAWPLLSCLPVSVGLS